VETRRVFYSWQLDPPRHAELDFIEKALLSAAETIRSDPNLAVELAADRVAASCALTHPSLGRRP